jgi:4-amino-4-deoxy-L-arabinose transferase-like glycosyltransferase
VIAKTPGHPPTNGVAAPVPVQPSIRPPVAWRTLAAFAVTTLILHLVIAGRYGWFRDEFYYIDAGKHLSGGYVDFPVMVALLADLQRAVFGTSLTALHVLPPVAGAGIIVLTGLMARELGGGLTAQRVAGLSALVAPAFVGADALFTMDAFDQLWWTLGAFILLRLLKLLAQPSRGRDVDQAKQRLWLLLGLVCGLGLLTKLTILGFGLVVAMALRDPARRELRTPWPYLAGLISAAFLVPYVVWEMAHGWPTLTFWNNYSHTEDPATFLIQVVLLMQPLALPLWVAGLWYLIRNPAAEPYRPVGWAFLTLAILFLGLHSKSYFLVPAFPPLLAAGAVALERQAARRPRVHLVALTSVALVLGGIVLAPVVAPILPPKTLASVMSSPIQPVADRFGWPKFVGTVSAVYHRLPPSQRRETTILAGNYGEAGALDLLGPADHLPRVISPHNTYYFWGQGITPGQIVIATDFRRSDLLPYCASVVQAAIVPSQDGIQNEEVGRPVFICRGLKMPWSLVWPRIRNFS